jgi:hypothetical protein
VEGAEVKPNFDASSTQPGPGRAVTDIVCAECNTRIGKILRSAQGAVWANYLAPNRADYSVTRTDKRARAPQMIASSPLFPGLVFWCRDHGGRNPLDANLIAELPRRIAL